MYIVVANVREDGILDEIISSKPCRDKVEAFKDIDMTLKNFLKRLRPAIFTDIDDDEIDVAFDEVKDTTKSLKTKSDGWSMITLKRNLKKERLDLFESMKDVIDDTYLIDIHYKVIEA